MKARGCGWLLLLLAASPALSDPKVASAPAITTAVAVFPPAQAAALMDALSVTFEAAPHASLSAAILYEDRAWLHGFGASPTTTTFRIASITKIFTALLAMQLSSEGKLDLDGDVRSVVPSFPQKEWPITPRRLLSHTAGIGHYRGKRDGMTTVALDTEGSLALFRDRPLLAEPGARFQYSSYGYVLLGAAIEGASGVSYQENLRQRALLPLGMTRTSLEAGMDRDAMQGFRLQNGQVVPAEPIEISSRFSSGGLRSTAFDLLRFARAILDHEVISQRDWATMIEPVVTQDGKRADYGLGLAVYPQRGHVVVAHAGGQPGASSLLMLIPEERLAVVLLSNLEGQAAVLSRMAASAVELLLEGGVPRRALYSDDPVDELVYDALNRVFSHGLASTKTSAPRLMKGEGATKRELTFAFDRLHAVVDRAALAADLEVGTEVVAELHHPKQGAAALLVGKEMARVIGGDLSAFHRLGPLAFFGAYLDVCEATPARCPQPLRGGLALEVRRLADHMAVAPPLRAEQLGLADEATLRRLLEPLHRLVGRPTHPDLHDDLLLAAARQQRRKAPAAAKLLRELAATLHPRAAQPAGKPRQLAPSSEPPAARPVTTRGTRARGAASGG